jgi:hypothetical protein
MRRGAYPSLCLAFLLHGFSVSAHADDAYDVLQNGVVEKRDGQWVVRVRLAQDRPDGGLTLRMASTIASRKLVEFACGFRPSSPGERVAAVLTGLRTLSSQVSDEWVQIIVAADVQKPKCKVEKRGVGALMEEDADPFAASGVTPQANSGPASVSVEPPSGASSPSPKAVVNEIRSDY